MRPIIGITTYVEVAEWGAWNQKAAVVPYTYVAAVHDTGARAVLLPPDSLDGDVVARLDGLIIAGGADVAPEYYGAEPHERTYVRPDRDAGEFALLGAAVARDLPVLGVCRGMQLMAVAYGGTLIQHLPDELGHTHHAPAPGVMGAHPVFLEGGSLIAKIMGERAEVNSYHHQGVADPGRLVVTGRGDDGVIEVLEDPTKRFVVGVQWHPEAMPQRALFAALTEAASGGGHAAR